MFEASSIAVVGATGAVGREALAILAARGHPAERVRAIASERSVGRAVLYGDGPSLHVRGFVPEELVDVDLVLLAVSADLARQLAPELVSRGARVVDNSSAFRLDPEVPLVVPEVNADQLTRDTRLVANPNCSTIMMLVALEPLRRAFGVEHIVASTYQAVSGAGLSAMEELLDQTRRALAEEPLDPRVFPEPCAFNVFPHESALDAESGLNEEEAKLIRETRRVWEDPSVGIVPTCARVPALRSHCQSLVVRLREPATVDELRAALSAAPGIALRDGSADGPTSLRAMGQDEIFVGRVRPTPDVELDGRGRTRSFCLWLAGDQLRKGAALNAIQIGERLCGPSG